MECREYVEEFSAGTSWPRVTVVVPLYNYAGMVTETLDCLLEQTVDAAGLVIVDDASSDDSLEVARQWCERNWGHFACLRLLRHTSNGGLSRARNTGISVTQSDYVFFLDADNQIYPSCLERLVEVLDSTDVAFAFTELEVFGSRSGVIGTRVFDAGLLAKGNYIDAMAMIRRSVLLNVGGYRVMKHGWEDFELWLRLAGAGQLGIQVPEILGRYRAHPGSMSNVSTAPNAETLKAELRALHPWFEMATMPQFVPRAMATAASGYWRYGLMAVRHLLDPRGIAGGRRALIRNVANGWRQGRLRGVAAVLREANAAKGHARKVPPKWLPAFDQDKEVAILANSENLAPLESARIAVLVYSETLERGQSVASGFQGQLNPTIIAPARAAGETGQAPGQDLVMTADQDACALAAWRELQRAVELQEFVVFCPFLGTQAQPVITHTEMIGLLRTALTAFAKDDALGLITLGGNDATLRTDHYRRELAALMGEMGIYSDPSLHIASPGEAAMFVFRADRFQRYFGATQAVMELPDMSAKRVGESAIALSYLFCEQSGSNWAEVRADQLVSES